MMIVATLQTKRSDSERARIAKSLPGTGHVPYMLRVLESPNSIFKKGPRLRNPSNNSGAVQYRRILDYSYYLHKSLLLLHYGTRQLSHGDGTRLSCVFCSGFFVLFCAMRNSALIGKQYCTPTLPDDD